MPIEYGKAKDADGPLDWEEAWRQNPNLPMPDSMIAEVSDIRLKSAMYVHKLRLVADTIERSPGLMTEEDPYTAAEDMLEEYGAIEDGYYDPDPGHAGISRDDDDEEGEEDLQGSAGPGIR